MSFSEQPSIPNTVSLSSIQLVIGLINQAHILEHVAYCNNVITVSTECDQVILFPEPAPINKLDDFASSSDLVRRVHEFDDLFCRENIPLDIKVHWASLKQLYALSLENIGYSELDSTHPFIYLNVLPELPHNGESFTKEELIAYARSAQNFKNPCAVSTRELEIAVKQDLQFQNLNNMHLDTYKED